MEKFDLNSGSLGLSSVETLYAQLQKVYIKTKKGEEKSKILRIVIEAKSGLTISLGKVLSLQITDDNDSTFFYSLLLSNEDFIVLKNQQGLLVDFDRFPAQLIKLLEACRSQELNKFILVLDEDDSILQKTTNDVFFLKVIETNNFKNLCHLSLKVAQGTDADIKNHMSNKIAALSEKLSEEEKKCRMIQMNLNEALKALDFKTKELTEVQLKLTEEKNSLRLEASQQISEEREKLSRLQMDWQQRLEAEKSQQSKQYQKQLNELNEQINSLTFNNKNLYEAKCHFETCVKEKSFHMEALEKQIAQLTQEVTMLKKQNAQIDQDYHDKDKAVVGLKTKLAVAEQELKDKVKLIEKQQELLKVANEQKQFFEEALNEKETHLQRKQGAVQTLSADLMKSNEIIAKLQTDLTANKAKMKLRTEIALEQEKVLEKKTQQIAAQIETIRKLEENSEKLKEELTRTKTQLEEATKQVEEKEIIIKKNDNVISWLNRKLSESAPNSAHIISSSRTASENMFPTVQPKGSISNLTRGWPSWLVNSMNSNNGDSTGSVTAGISNTSNGASRPSISSTPVELIQDQCRSRLQKPEENNENGNKELKNDTKASGTEPKPRGLDPKYFQSCTDKDYAVNPQIVKVCNGKDSWKSTETKTSSRPNSGRQPTSAYFPKKPVLL